MAMAVLGLSARAQAAPSSTAPYATAPSQNITLNHTVVSAGGEVTGTVSGAVAGHNINFYIHSADVYLATYRANSSGVASGPLNIPSSFRGAHTIVAKDPLNGQTWNTPLTIVSAAAAGSATSSSSSSGTTGGLPNTGAAVMGLGVLVLILLTGGATLLLLGRRRVRSTH